MATWQCKVTTPCCLCIAHRLASRAFPELGSVTAFNQTCPSPSITALRCCLYLTYLHQLCKCRIIAKQEPCMKSPCNRVLATYEVMSHCNVLIDRRFWCRWSGYWDLLPDELEDMPVFWKKEDLQPLRNTSMAEKLSDKWPMAGCHVEPPSQVKPARNVNRSWHRQLVLRCTSSMCLSLDNRCRCCMPGVSCVHYQPTLSFVGH